MERKEEAKEGKGKIVYCKTPRYSGGFAIKGELCFNRTRFVSVRKHALCGKKGEVFMPQSVRVLPKYVHASKVIKLGGVNTPHELRQKLVAIDCDIELHASNILNKIDVLGPPEKDVEVFVVSNESIGYPLGAKLRDTFMRANAHRFMPCPAEVAPEICLQLNRGEGFDDVVVVMKPIQSFLASAPHLFRVVIGPRGKSLLSIEGSFDCFLDKDTRFVLMRRMF